ncbi:MAG: prepilin-type N-terminal cleavage/methylation domain-containing protein, partial [Gemmatimonadota bacterium]
MNDRAGVSLVELLVALALTALLCGLLVGPVVTVEGWARRQAVRIVVAEAMRVPAAALRAELRWLRPDTDIGAMGGDSIALRAFRGEAIVCGVDEDGHALVRYRGVRRPDPEKDSALVVAGAGAGTPAALRSSTTALDDCETGPGESVLRWSLDAPLAIGSLLLLFERGSYHLADGALRFRRGLSGRQPITARRIDEASRLRPLDRDGRPTYRADSVVAFVLRLRPDAESVGEGGGAVPDMP